MSISPLVLVVGMHRSGTSMLGGILQKLGVGLPGELVSADEHNPAGYYEWDRVVSIQERLLIDLDRWWPSLQGCQPLPEGWLQHPATVRASLSLRELLSRQINHQLSPWCIKDPRTSRLLPLWIGLASELQLPLRLILAVRDPVEVVRSLVKRDGPITGMDHNRAQQLWWRHNVEVLHTARAFGLPVSVIVYGRWFDQPAQQLTALLEALPECQPSDQMVSAALAGIRPELRRSLTGSAAVESQQAVLPSVRRLHARLLKQGPARSGRRPWNRLPPVDPPRALLVEEAPLPSAAQLRSDPGSWGQWLEMWRHYPAPRWVGPLAFGAQPRISCCGMAWDQLLPHLLWQHVPVQGLPQRRLNWSESGDHQLCFVSQSAAAPDGPEHLALNLELPEPDRIWHWLNLLAAQQIIWDPDPARVCLLRALGLKAWWLDPEEPLNGWLDQADANDPTIWSAQFGLPPVQSGCLLLLGHAGELFDQAMAAEAAGCPLTAAGDLPPLAYLPGWSDLVVTSPQAGLTRAGWLQHAARQAERLIWPDQKVPSEWTLLEIDQHPPLAAAPPSSPAELRALHRGEPLTVAAEERISPATETLFDSECVSDQTEESPPLLLRAAVLVSLFNYADRIEAALDSVASQTEKALELVVVDDHSSDQGAMIVRDWMQRHAGRFERCLLLKHATNAGLAAARNTAFQASKAPWCFVLDADNALFPQAVQSCMELADQSSASVAVVHPLVAVEAEAGRADEQRSLVGLASWQNDRFRAGNYIDAMALVRRSAWEAVGGYTHIEGGWEDYDFWCKLVESGFHGMQCPSIQAVYRSHSDSMTMHSTSRLQRSLSRTLQDRHPWLELPLASD